MSNNVYEKIDHVIAAYGRNNTRLQQEMKSILKDVERMDVAPSQIEYILDYILASNPSPGMISMIKDYRGGIAH